MTAARRGQEAASPPIATSTVAKLPPVGCPANPQPHLDHPHQRARACHLTCASTPSGRVAEQGVTMQFVDK